MGIITEVIRPTEIPGTRPEDRPGFDPDLQVCRMVNAHRAQVLREKSAAEAAMLESREDMGGILEEDQTSGEFLDAEIWEPVEKGTRAGRLAVSLELLLRTAAGALLLNGIGEGWVTPTVGGPAGAMILLACGVRFWEARHGN